MGTPILGFIRKFIYDMADFRNKDALLGEIFERKHAYEFLIFNDRQSADAVLRHEHGCIVNIVSHIDTENIRVMTERMSESARPAETERMRMSLSVTTPSTCF